VVLLVTSFQDYHHVETPPKPCNHPALDIEPPTPSLHRLSRVFNDTYGIQPPRRPRKRRTNSNQPSFPRLPPPTMSTATQTRTDSSSSASSSPSTKIDTIKQSAAYLMYGSAAGASAVPTSWKTRSVLTTARYVSKYIFWRLIRYAKYAVAVSPIVVALGKN
jgi:hypothetical protein